MSAAEATLWRLIEVQPELLYAFLATSDGQLVARAGQKDSLPETDVVDTTESPEIIRRFVAANEAYEKQDPRLVPRLYAQGRTYGVIGVPEPGFLLAAFGSMPAEVEKAAPLSRAQWIEGFRRRVWSAVVATRRAEDSASD